MALEWNGEYGCNGFVKHLETENVNFVKNLFQVPDVWSSKMIDKCLSVKNTTSWILNVHER